MRLVLLFLFLFYAASASTENLPQPPAHHLSDGTYANTNGVPYESSFKKLMQWSWERRSKDLSTFKFEMEKPNYKEIYNNDNIVTTWIGHETFLYQNKDINVLTDPHFTDRASPLSFAGPKRYMPPGMEIDDLPNIDVVTISHSHYDHLDYRSVKLISEKYEDVLFLVPLGLEEWFINKGIKNVRELDWWDSIKVSDTEITFAPVQHLSLIHI